LSLALKFLLVTCMMGPLLAAARPSRGAALMAWMTLLLLAALAGASFDPLALGLLKADDAMIAAAMCSLGLRPMR
jgi:hypothetical protein